MVESTLELAVVGVVEADELTVEELEIAVVEGDELVVELLDPDWPSLQGSVDSRSSA